jgi:exosortase/archaeosortase family protein
VTVPAPADARSFKDRASASLDSTRFRLGAGLLLVALAFHYSLRTLISAWRYQTPLADLVLVPLIAAGLFVVAALRSPAVGATRLRRVDLVLAGTALVLALFAVLVLPTSLGSYYWVVRPDLLAVPLTAVAAVALLFGARTLLAFIFPLGFLALLWPLPHAIVVEQLLIHVTNLTQGAVRALIGVMPIASVVPGGLDLRLQIPHGAEGFVVSVASACSGTESLIGFGLVGLAAMYLVKGPAWRRLTWLAVGAIGVWVGNLARILGIVAVGRWLGPEAALDVLHPVAGILVINVVFIALIAMLPWFGLTRRSMRTKAHGDSPASRPDPPELLPSRRRVTAPLAVLVLAASGLAVANSQLAGAATAFSNTGHPASTPFAARPVVGTGWQVRPLDRFDWAKQYFGDDATWTRWRMRPTKENTEGRFTMWADSITTSDYAALLAHPVRDCYSFHGFKILANQRVQITTGIVGERVVYQRPDGARWHVVTWQWPVAKAGAAPGSLDDVGHERMTLLASTRLPTPGPVSRPSSGGVNGPVLAVLNLRSADRDPNPGLSKAMVQAARDMIRARMAPTGGPVLPPAPATAPQANAALPTGPASSPQANAAPEQAASATTTPAPGAPKATTRKPAANPGRRAIITPRVTATRERSPIITPRVTATRERPSGSRTAVTRRANPPWTGRNP